ncbi:MAG: hypothetical protein AMS19_14820 [Gemmatimonas sp. SG8_23]|jgi:hypothetical protein|nr:MAG: hypothetical protein AMS19_14820 [Gemmatimonas sp. SG8_23]
METVNTLRSRLRFDSLEHITTPDGSGRVSVRLEWADEAYEGTVSCLQTQQGVLKAASEATLIATVSAALAFSDDPIDLEVVGVKAVRAFDGWVVVTRVNGLVETESYRLLGAAPCEREEDLPGAAVKAILNACNRIVEHRVAR